MDTKEVMLLKKLQDPSFWLNQCLNNLYFFCRCVLQTLEHPGFGYPDLYRPTHQHICDFISKYAQPEHKVLLLCPRGWIKSYIVTVGWVLQKFLRNIVENRKAHFIITNATMPNARIFLKKIKYNLQFNTLLKAIFADYLPDDMEEDSEHWTQDDIEIRGNTIELGSVEGNLISRHFGIMVHDDLVNLDNMLMTSKIIDWWKLAQSLLEARGIEIIIGTRWEVTDLYGFIIENFLQIPSSIKHELRERPFYEWHNGRYHLLSYSCWENPLEEKGSTFPTLFPEQRLKQIKEAQAEFFDGQYRNDPHSLTDSIFKKKWFCYWYEHGLPSRRITFMLVDPMGRETKQSDYMGLVVADAGSDKKIYVRYAQRDKKTDVDAVRWIVQVALTYLPDMIGIEEYKYETFRDLIEFIIPQMIAQGQVPKALREYAMRIPHYFVKLRHHNRPKKIRIMNLTGWFEEARILLPPSGVNDLIDELLTFGRSERDDILDALAYILDIVAFPSSADPPKELTPFQIASLSPEEREKQFWESLPEIKKSGEIDYDHIY
ncbi:MAG: hypothetical protein NC828_01600 [Candidatus Omnitrophica bacterium]|nr:hypothetical protein [Candidatus Omnitrophota bacterium]